MARLGEPPTGRLCGSPRCWSVAALVTTARGADYPDDGMRAWAACPLAMAVEKSARSDQLAGSYNMA
jgi:hypothetical protein